MTTAPKTLRVDLGNRGYDIAIGHQTLSGLGEALKPFGFSRKTAVITNPTVGDLYGEGVERGLRDAGFEVVVARMGDGEQYKNLETVSNLWDQLLAERLVSVSPDSTV